MENEILYNESDFLDLENEILSNESDFLYLGNEILSNESDFLDLGNEILSNESDFLDLGNEILSNESDFLYLGNEILSNELCFYFCKIPSSFPFELVNLQQRRMGMDIWDKKKRSAVMARIKSKDTKPELIVRRYLYRRVRPTLYYANTAS